MKDQIFAAPRSETEDFSFNEQVAEVFHDMAQRSIPGYSTIINTIGSLTAQYAQNSSRLYDLGCSLGTATICMRKNLKKEQNCRIIAVDTDAATFSTPTVLIFRWTRCIRISTTAISATPRWWC